MSIFSKFKMPTVNEGINRARTEENAALVDVRDKESYKAGHIAGSVNIPFGKPELILTRIPDKTKTLFLVGTYEFKPGTMAKKFKKLGYKNVIPSGYFEEHRSHILDKS